MRNICSVANCGKFVKGRGLCNNHYTQWFHKVGPQGKHVVYSFRTDDPKILKKRFDQKWQLDEKSGCWNWTSSQNKPHKSYSYRSGQIVVLGKKKRAHRVSWELHRGAIPDDLDVLHKCDNGLCVNPDHLYLGTHEDNMRDMAARERTHYRKVTNQQALEIRQSHESAYQIYLSGKYGIGYSCIKLIKNGKSKRHA